ncbi:MAG: PilN domain-containing protein [Acidobacteriota bacterium]|nr:PilN domain-containing protein [Acidobacteriota bacterium]
MIRINLLAVERERTRKRTGGGFDASARITLVCLLILLATVAGIGFWAWSLNEASSDLDRQIAGAQTEARRLHSVIQQVQQFEKQRGELQQRVALIEELRKGQTNAVHLLDEVSRSLPDMVWLTDLKESDDGVVTIDGRCTSLTAVSDFVANLERSPYFKKPVELVGSQTQTIPEPPGELIRFTLKATFAPPQS